MLTAELSRMWEEEKLEAVSIDNSFIQLCYKGQERNEMVAGCGSGNRRKFLL